LILNLMMNLEDQNPSFIFHSDCPWFIPENSLLNSNQDGFEVLG